MTPCTIIKSAIVLFLVSSSALARPTTLKQETDHHDQSAHFARRQLGPAQIAAHFKNSIRLGTGYLKQVSVPGGKTVRPTFAGVVSALRDPKSNPSDPLKIHPADLNHYAKAGNQHIKLDGSHDHIMAAAHKEGSDTVHLHSIPRGSALIQQLTDGGTHPALESKMREGPNPQVHPDSGKLAHHAETAAVNKGMLAEASKSTKGWSVGQAGNFKNGNPVLEPCQGKCQQTFKKAGITYQNKHGEGHPNHTNSPTSQT